MELPTNDTVVWRSVSMAHGEQCILNFGALLMPVWLADKLDIHPMVS